VDLVRLTLTFAGNMIAALDLRRRVNWPLNRGASVNRISGAVGTILKRKGGEIWSVRPDQTVYEAVEMMADKGVGALLVISDGKLAGIISERDYTRKVILKGKSSKETPVRDIMTVELVTAHPGDSISECMHVMTEKRVRHLPVMEGVEMVGLVSIGDLVRRIISAQTATIDNLEKYITGDYPA